jgi:aminoglycoside phosphotransferase (APT) family kinase protein
MSHNDFSDDQLQALWSNLSKTLHSDFEEATIKRLTGGQSNPTYAIEASGQKYALRKKPAGAILASAHAVEREFAVMKALAMAKFPVPKMLHLFEDASIIGTPFYVMEFLDGRIFYNPTLPGLSNQERSAIHDAANATQAALHQVDFKAIGLGEFGKTGNYMTRQIERWSKQYQASETQRIDAMHALMEWLPANTPASDEVSIVHGDYRLDNLVFAMDSPTVIGVLDWELSTLGNPLADFAYHCMAWHIPQGGFRGLAGTDFAGLGIPTEHEYVRRYCERTGRDAQSFAKDWSFYLAYNLFRAAAILVGVAKRASQGNAASSDAAAVGKQALPLSQLALKIAHSK